MCSVPRWRPDDERAYAYLLGLYLGDGCLVRTKLFIYCDSSYPSLIAECVASIRGLIPDTTIRAKARSGSRCTVVSASSTAWLAAFPQHGPGKKHLRRIELAPWQREIVERYPRPFLRGLVHSDGCRTVNRFSVLLKHGPKEYEYVRYFFSNLSTDILALFCDACDRLGIRWTRSNSRNVSVSHRHGVSLLDSFVGPKS